MMGRTHALSGLVAAMGVVAGFDLSPTAAPILAAVGVLSAYGPDVDHPNSTAAKCLPPVSTVLCAGVRAVSVRVVGIKHRGATHTAVFAAGWGVLIGALSAQWLVPVAAVWVGVFAAVGWLSGVLGDVPTRQSLKYVLWPSTRQVVWPRWLRFTTGRAGEQWVFRVLVVAGALLLPAVVS